MLPFHLPRLFQIRGAPLAHAFARALHASGTVHAALCDMAVLARLASEVALQAKGSGLVAADDVRGVRQAGDSFVTSRSYRLAPIKK